MTTATAITRRRLNDIAAHLTAGACAAPALLGELPPRPLPHRWVGEPPSPLAQHLHADGQLISRQVEAAFAPLVRAILEEDGSDPVQYHPNGLHQGIPERYAAPGDAELFPAGRQAAKPIAVPAELQRLVEIVEQTPFAGMDIKCRCSQSAATRPFLADWNG